MERIESMSPEELTTFLAAEQPKAEDYAERLEGRYQLSADGALLSLTAPGPEGEVRVEARRWRWPADAAVDSGRSQQ